MAETTGGALLAGHTLKLENRERLQLTGVKDVAGFDESAVVLTTDLGELTVRGEGLHIEQIDLAEGLLKLRGSVRELAYSENSAHAGWWAKLFG